MQSKKSVLSKEQLQMYEILGISLTSFNEINYDPGDLVVEKVFEENNEDDQLEIEPDSDDSEVDASHMKEYNNELVNTSLERIKTERKQDGGGDDKQQQEQQQQVVKRPFLKRGVGLKTRFRIPPDAFNLKKLPRYKYQDRLQKTLQKQKGFVAPEPKKTSIQNKSEVEKKKIVEEVNKNELSVPKNIILKAPEVKSQATPLNFEKLLPKPLTKSSEQIQETPKVLKPVKGTSWAQILTSTNIDDCSVKIDQLLDVQLNEDDHDETSLFQLLEERIKNLEESPASLMKLLASLQIKENNYEEENNTLVNPDDPLIENPDEVCLQLEPHPEDLSRKIIIDESEESQSESESEDESEHRVRFAEEVQVHQQKQETTQNNNDDDDANSTILSSDMEQVELSQTSTPNERQKFEDFKLKMFGRQTQQNDLKEKVDLLKIKLEDIEREKNKIIQMRSNLELDRVQFEHEREDFMERMKDERMKMEIELHDERVKLDQQKQKYDKLLRESKNQASKKEREEITKLKEIIEELKEENKNKETRHASTMARYRTQIKQLEKENQTLKLEMEMAKKENKRMELENARLKRDTNSKMLQEINKNIAKLANPNLPSKSEEKKKVDMPAPKRKSEPAPRKKVVPPKESSSESDEDEEPKSHSTKRFDSTSDVSSEMKREIVNSNGSKDIWYPNGNLKKISPDGMVIRMLYYNKDIKETNINEGTVKYYYADNNTWHTTYIDGLEILEYPK